MSRRKNSPRYARAERNGSVMIVAIACMAIVTSMVFMIARDAARARRETRLRLQIHQTERLLDAGILRARLKINEDSAYNGERWSPKLTEQSDQPPANVKIQVDSNTVTVTASIGTSPLRTTQTHTFITSDES